MTSHKNKIKVSLMALLFASNLYTQAQTTTPYSVSGVLCDSTTHQAEAFATVRLLQLPTKKPVKAVLTQADGSFRITAPRAGRYLFEVISMGKEPIRQTLSFDATTKSVKMDTLYIKEYDASLGVAEVVAQRPLVKAEIDKMTYSMAEDPDAKNNTLLEMLRKVPMVTVDGEDNVKVNGNASFKVYVDGKPNAMMSANPSMIFKAYPASAIKKIEVITNPGAKYDAEGVAGVLNIITNTQTATQGYTLTLNGSVGNRGESGSAFAVAQFGKFMLSAHYGTGYHKQPVSTTTMERELYDETLYHLLQSHTVSKGHGMFQFGNLEASYEFSPKDLLSVSAGIHGWNGKNNNTSINKMFAVDGNETYRYQVASRTKSLYQTINASADFQHSFTEDNRLTLSYQYSHNPQTTQVWTENTDMVNLPANFGLKDLASDPDNLSYEQTAQVDFTSALDKKKQHTLSVGLKYINRINRSNNVDYTREAGSDDEFTRDETRSLRYRHQGDIGAAYLQYNLKIKNWAAMVGNRYEYYHVRVTYPDGKSRPFGTHMDDWVPSVTLGYNLKPTMMLKAGYNLRIARPDISYLSPYQVSYSPEAVKYGNPNLKSEKGHNLNMTFSTFSAKLTLNATLTYAFSNNGMEEYSFVKDGVMYTTYEGFRHSKETTLSTFINWTIIKGTTLNLNASGSYADRKAQVIGCHNSGFAGNAWGGIQQVLPWKMKLGLWLGGNTKQVTLQGRTAGFYFYSLNLSRTFLKEDRLSVNLQAGNFIGRYHNFRNTTSTSQMHMFTNTRTDFLRYSIGISYRLGSLKASVKKTQRSIENDDVLKGNNSNNVSGEMSN